MLLTMIYCGRRGKILRDKSRACARQLLDLTDAMEFSLTHTKMARELSSWRHFWVAPSYTEAWNAISYALTSERVRRVINENVKAAPAVNPPGKPHQEAQDETSKLDFKFDTPTLMD